MIVLDGLALGDAEHVAQLEARVEELLAGPTAAFDLDLGAKILKRMIGAKVVSFATFKGNVPRDYVGWILRLSGGDSIVYVQDTASQQDHVILTNATAIVSEAEVQG